MLKKQVNKKHRQSNKAEREKILDTIYEQKLDARVSIVARLGESTILMCVPLASACGSRVACDPDPSWKDHGNVVF